MKEQALLALQGPEAVAVLERIVPGVAELGFMQAAPFHWDDQALWISRSGYTGEDGFEISVPASRPRRWPTRSSPIPWPSRSASARAISAVRSRPAALRPRPRWRDDAGDGRPDLRHQQAPQAEGGFPGFERIVAELEGGPAQKRVGLLVEGRQPVREGATVLDGEGNDVGRVTSGGFSPTLQRPIAMAYVAAPFAGDGTALKLQQRGKLFEASVAPMPFVPHRYHRKPKGV